MSALAMGLDAIQKVAGSDPVVAAKARGLLIGYDHRWKDSGWQTVSTEEVFHLPIVNPQTGAKSRTFMQAGKFDGIISRNGATYLLEHKTTSEDIADPAAPYWKRLAIDSQVSAYVLAKWQQGQKLDGTLYDVIRKPGIRPKNIAKAELRYLMSSRTYFGYQVSEEIQNRIALEGKDSVQECPELYAMRLAADCIENPDRYFQRRPVPRLDSDITEYAEELWEVGQSILSARSRNAHYRNSGACMEYNTPCRFLGICSGFDSPDSDRWRSVENVHDELPVLSSPRNVLSNSRLKTFQSCRRKHYYHYELGIRRVDDEDSEALVLGSLFHEGLRAWWDFYRKEKHVNSETAAGGTESPAAAATKELPF